jgi:NAD(P)-dependent dehydrogenase (short-subunit alcohol dehydrogenase family)
MDDDHDMQSQREKYAQKPEFDAPIQPEPGLESKMEPRPDHGEESYKGHGRLKGRRALVTGGDSGIGRAVAIAFAREGADVVITYLPEEEPDAKEVMKTLEATGQKIAAIPGDISSESFCRNLIEQTVETIGGIDILANIAGKQVAQEDIEDISTEQFEQTFRVNVFAMLWLCKYSLQHMPDGGSIINTASIQAYQPSPTLLDYASTKAAIKAFTEALAKQVADRGIRINAVAPGPIWTPIQPSHGQPPEKLPNIGKDTPLGRPGQPAEVAPAYVFLASQDASYITAEMIGVTGGQHLP